MGGGEEAAEISTTLTKILPKASHFTLAGWFLDLTATKEEETVRPFDLDAVDQKNGENRKLIETLLQRRNLLKDLEQKLCQEKVLNKEAEELTTQYLAAENTFAVATKEYESQLHKLKSAPEQIENGSCLVVEHADYAERMKLLQELISWSKEKTFLHELQFVFEKNKSLAVSRFYTDVNPANN